MVVSCSLFKWLQRLFLHHLCCKALTLRSPGSPGRAKGRIRHNIMGIARGRTCCLSLSYYSSLTFVPWRSPSHSFCPLSIEGRRRPPWGPGDNTVPCEPPCHTFTFKNFGWLRAIWPICGIDRKEEVVGRVPGGEMEERTRWWHGQASWWGW